MLVEDRFGECSRRGRALGGASQGELPAWVALQGSPKLASMYWSGVFLFCGGRFLQWGNNFFTMSGTFYTAAVISLLWWSLSALVENFLIVGVTFCISRDCSGKHAQNIEELCMINRSRSFYRNIL